MMKKTYLAFLIPLFILILWKVFFSFNSSLLKVHRREIDKRTSTGIDISKDISDVEDGLGNSLLKEPSFRNLLLIDKGVLKRCLEDIKKHCNGLPTGTPQVYIDHCLHQKKKILNESCRKKIDKRMLFYKRIKGKPLTDFYLPCKIDTQKLCKNSTSSEFILRPCLLKNLSRLSSRCYSHIQNDFIQRRLKVRELTQMILEFQLRGLDSRVKKIDKCDDDIKRLCKNQKNFIDITKECLFYNWGELSMKCKNQMGSQ